MPGKPALFGTTKAFLDYFNLASLDDLPSLAEIADMENLEPELDLEAHEDSGDEDQGDTKNGDPAVDDEPADSATEAAEEEASEIRVVEPVRT